MNSVLYITPAACGLSRRAWPGLDSDKEHSEGNGQKFPRVQQGFNVAILYQQQLTPLPVAQRRCPLCSGGQRTLEVSSALLFLERISSPPLSGEKTATGGTSSLWSCFKVGSVQDGAEGTMAAPNLQVGETGWEKSPDGVVPS